MPGPYPLATLACTIGPTGITSPAYSDIYESLQASFQSIYGSDAYISPDSQDGQMLAIFAQAIYDANQAAIAVYNQFNPTYAQGTGLSSVVKINGLQRESSQSTAAVAAVGTVGTVITNGAAQDGNGNVWFLPASVTIGVSGLTTVTATCQTPGAVTAPPNTINQIITPTLGWQTVTNPADAAPGAPVESDAALRQRQSISTSLPAQTPLDAVVANVANVGGVEQVQGYENKTGAPDSNGIPGHTISLVVEGGDVVAVATAIAEKKTSGTGTYGTTAEVIVSSLGIPNTINFFVLAFQQVYMSISLQPLVGFVNTTVTLIQDVLAAYVSGLGIGQTIVYNKLNAPANLSGTVAVATTRMTQAQLDAISATYDIKSLTIGLSPSPTNVTDQFIPFNLEADLTTGDIAVTVL